MSLTIKTGDTSPGPRVQLFGRDGTAADLTGATVVMQVEGRADTSFPVTVVDAATGIVRVPRGDLTAPDGRRKPYRVEFQVTYLDTTVQTFPETEYALLTVWSQLDGS